MSSSKFRCGVAPIKIETGRYQHIAPEERFFFNCKNVIENEKHFLLECPLYNYFRVDLFTKYSDIREDFLLLSESNKLSFIVNNVNICAFSAKICYNILKRRKCILYV